MKERDQNIGNIIHLLDRNDKLDHQDLTKLMINQDSMIDH